MNKLSIAQLKALSDFSNTIAAGWFGAGVIAPFFSPAQFLEKLTFFTAGAILSYLCLKLSLFFVEGVD